MAKRYLGIEFGSTRIKASLIDEKGHCEAAGSYGWQDRQENGYWTYDLEEAVKGLQAVYKELREDFKNQKGEELTELSGIGISAMMHGYLAFDKEDQLLVPFRTWRNTVTAKAAGILSERFGFNIPQRWSIAHLYQSILEKQPHVSKIAYITTLAGYIHYCLTGEKVLGTGDASGMFPIGTDGNYDAAMAASFNELLKEEQLPYRIEEILPEVRPAGRSGGVLTEAGAALLDPTGSLKAGVPVCPPEGDAGTGMAATNSVRARTGNISAGTSVFAMAVLEHPLKNHYEAIDVVTTPDGKPVAMVHCNTCTSDLNAWVNLFKEAANLFGANPDTGTLYNSLFTVSKKADAVCGGVTNVNYYSGEPVTDTPDGKPMLYRDPSSALTLANFMKSQLYSCVATLRLGMDILIRKENVRMDAICGHGGFFKTPEIGQQVMADALNLPVTVMETAGEGGAWGMALLAAYADHCVKEPLALEDYLEQVIFAESGSVTLQPSREGAQDFENYLERYRTALKAEKCLLGE